jgi:hypothetical protein
MPLRCSKLPEQHERLSCLPAIPDEFKSFISIQESNETGMEYYVYSLCRTAHKRQTASKTFKKKKEEPELPAIPEQYVAFISHERNLNSNNMEFKCGICSDENSLFLLFFN